MTDGIFYRSLTSHLPIIDVVDSTTISSEYLHWLTEFTEWNINYGDTVAQKMIDDHLVGILYWSGPVGTFVYLPESGTYQFTIRAQNITPPPIVIEIEDGFVNIGSFTLSHGDLSWEEFHFSVDLDKGIHLVDIFYVNDELVNGVDRNAILDWIRIERIY